MNCAKMLVGLYSNRNSLFPAEETSENEENVDLWLECHDSVVMILKSIFVALNLIMNEILLL